MSIDSQARPKDLLKISLFMHQLVNIYKMEQLERRKQVECEYYDTRITGLGLVADKTGAGKTLSVIGLVLRDKMEWDMDTLFVSKHTWTEAGGLIENIKLDRRPKLPCTLVLVSSSIVSQWRHELAYTNLKFKIET